MRWNRMLRVALFLTALLFSCALGLSRALALTPDELVAQGDAFLEARNTVDAYGRYLAARDLDPDHPGANLGLALLNLPDKLVDGGDPAFAAFLATWGVELAGNIFGLEVSRDEEVGLPPVPALQDIIVTCVLPHLDQSLVYLQAVRALPGWERVFTPEMFGFDPSEDEPRKWGLVETHALEVAFNLLKGALNFACAYDLDIDWVDLDGGENGFGWFLENYPQLLTIRAGGPARMDAALAGFRAALDAALAAWDANDARNAAGYLVPPPPGPDDDPWDFTYWADYRALLGDIRALFDDAGGTLDLNRYRVAMWEEVSGSPIIMPLDLNLSRLFSAPLTRADLPEFDDEGEPVFDGFDFTLNGLLPGLTREAALGFIFGDAELWESERHVTIVDGNTIRVAWFHYDGPEELDGIAGFRLYRGDTVNVDENDHLVGQGTVAQLRGPDVPWAQAAFSLTDPAAPADSYFYRLYIDYHDGYYTTSDSLPAFRRVYVDRHYAGPEPEEGTAARPFRWLGLAGQVLAPGTAMYVAGGEYRVADDFSGDDPGGLNIRASGVRVVGSCNPNDWNHADINVFPTVIDVAGFWWGVAVFTPDWRQHEGPVENISIENLVVRDSRGAGIQVNGARDVTVRNCLVRGSGQWNFRGGIEFNHVEGLRVEHCTAVDNSRGITGSMISGQVELVGNIAAWNGGEGVSLGAGGGGPPVFLFTHNNAWGNNPDFGQDSDFSHLVGLDGNISENPRFENRAAGDYRPAWDSPCAGAGPGGSDMGALAAAPPETGIPGWRAWWEGIGVGDWEAAPGAGVFEDYSGDGELNIFKFFRGAPPDEVRAGDPAWTTADLAGDWDVHGVTVIHRAGRADPAVWRGTATVDDEGRFLLEDMTGLLIDQGRLHAGPDGLVALVGRDYSFGAFQPGGRHFFLGMNRWLPAKAAREEVFTAFARRTRGDVTVADFAGHHAKHSLRLAENQWQNPGIIGPVPSDEVFFNAEGGMIVHGIEVARLVPDGPAGHFDFENPGPEPQPTDIFGAGDFAAGVLGDGLAPFIGRWLDGQGDPAEWEFGFLVRAGGEFRQADLAGRWAAVGFDSGGAWHCAFVDIDEEYLPGQPNVRVRTMPGLPGSEEFQAQINITGDGAIFTPAGTWWGQMDRSGNLVVIRDVHGDMLEERGVRALVRTTAGYEPPAPEIASVAPAAAWPVRPVPVVIAGDHFQPGAAVALVNGAVEAPGSEISVNGRREITAVFDPGGWGLAPGFYDVLVVNPDGQAALLAGGFEVRALEEGAGPRRLSLHLSGPAVAHPGARGLLFRVTCANESAAPVPAVTVSVFLPDEFGGGVVPFDFGVLPAGAAATATFTVDVAGGAVPGARVLTGAEARAGGELCDDRSLLTRITGRYCSVS